ncbi:MAG: hypothetical protein AAF197_10215, partial [Pseudomonadota bacterium]
YQAARSLSQEVVDFIPGYSLLWFLSQLEYENSGDSQIFNQMLESVEQAPRYLRESSELLSIKIQALAQRGDVEDAEAILAEWKRRAHDLIQINDLASYIAYQKQDFEGAEKIDSENASLLPSVWRNYNLAVSRYSLGNLKGAMEAIDSALKINNKDIFSRQLKAALSMITGNIAAALQIYAELDIAAMDAPTLANYGVARLLEQEWDAAKILFEQAVSLNPTIPLHHLLLGDVQNLAGQDKLAEESYRRVVELSSEVVDPSDHSAYGQALAQLGQYRESLRIIDQAKIQFPNNSDVLYAAALVQVLAGNLEMAMVEIERLSSLDFHPVWFDFVWFEPLCHTHGFKSLIQPQKICG